MVLDLRMGDTLELRRRHPCGGFAWDVVRVGADIGLRCTTCDRRILMDRPTLHRRLKAMLERGPEVDPAITAALFGEGEPSGNGGPGSARSAEGNR